MIPLTAKREFSPNSDWNLDIARVQKAESEEIVGQASSLLASDARIAVVDGLKVLKLGDERNYPSSSQFSSSFFESRAHNMDGW